MAEKQQKQKKKEYRNQNMDLSDFVEKVTTHSGVVRVFGNPLVVALIVCAVIFLVMYFVMRDQIEIVDESSGSYIKFVFTTGFYTTIAVIGLLQLHHKIVQTTLEKRYGNIQQTDLIDQVVRRNNL